MEFQEANKEGSCPTPAKKLGEWRGAGVERAWPGAFAITGIGPLTQGQPSWLGEMALNSISAAPPSG